MAMNLEEELKKADNNSRIQITLVSHQNDGVATFQSTTQLTLYYK